MEQLQPSSQLADSTPSPPHLTPTNTHAPSASLPPQNDTLPFFYANMQDFIIVTDNNMPPEESEPSKGRKIRLTCSIPGLSSKDDEDCNGERGSGELTEFCLRFCGSEALIPSSPVITLSAPKLILVSVLVYK
ncbi:hypothetical protein E2C01_008412 [Portunus trituberculatus]|uniref:Uncharacterized protein n=1 Tax=Portunus trituberculatus TaxID=210409 RepID=A0A5B7D5E4_PORTR|nr:hypothetical protein [Portunus trituberculatus]